MLNCRKQGAGGEHEGMVFEGSEKGKTEISCCCGLIN